MSVIVCSLCSSLAHIMPKSFIMMVDEKLLMSMGSMKMHRVQQAITQQMP